MGRSQQRVPRPSLPPTPSLPAIPGELPASTPGNPVDGVPPAPPGATVNGAPAPERPTVTLDFQNQPVTELLNYYETLSGKHVIADNSVQGPINLRITRPVPPAVALRMIETALDVNGFAVVPADDDTVKVYGLSKNPRSYGVPIYGNVEDLPDTAQTVTLFVRLENLDPQETAGLLTTAFPPTPTTAYTPFEKARALLVTDTARSARRLYDLIRQLDRPGADIKEKFIRLERADATKAVEFLKSVFETKDSAGTPAGNVNPNGGGAPIPGRTIARPIRRVAEDGSVAEVPGLTSVAGGLTLNRDSLIVGRVTLTADVRTNRVHVVTTEANLEVVEKLLADYDSNTAFAQPVRFPLKFIRPDLLLPILVQSLQENGDEKNGATPGATNPNKNGQTNANNNQGNSSFGGLNGGSSGGLGGSSFGSLGSLGSGSTQEIDTTPLEVTVGNNRLIADISNSSIILLGGADARDKVAAIITQLDRRSPQVLIHTIIGELSIGNNRELGFQYLLRTNRLGLSNNAGLLTSTSPTATPAATPVAGASTSTSALASLGALASGLGSGFSGVGGVLAVGRSLDIVLSALESTNRFKTISRPSITTQNFKKATIASGQTITVSTGSVGSISNVTNSQGVYNQTTQEAAVLQLSVTPQINSDKEVVMEVDQQINSPIGSSTPVNGVSNQQLSIRSLHNWVSARNGETVVLGGLITQDDNISDSNIPYLSRIPLLGNLFKSRTRDAIRSELIILMQPEVVETASVMTQLREREEDKTYLGPYLDRQIDPLEQKKPIRKAIPVQGNTITTTTIKTKRMTTVPTRK